MIKSISITLHPQKTADRCQGLQGQPAPEVYRRDFYMGLCEAFDTPIFVDFSPRYKNMLAVACDGGSNAEIQAALTKIVAVQHSVEGRHNVRGGVS